MNDIAQELFDILSGQNTEITSLRGRDLEIRNYRKYRIMISNLVKEDPNLVNIQNSKGQTLLHCAVSANNFIMCRLLISAGARADIKDGSGNLCYTGNSTHGERAEIFVRSAANYANANSFKEKYTAWTQLDHSVRKYIDQPTSKRTDPVTRRPMTAPGF